MPRVESQRKYSLVPSQANKTFEGYSKKIVMSENRQHPAAVGNDNLV